MQKLISIIIPSYNYAHFLPETIKSVITQTYKNIECIIIDDGSTDNTSEIVSGFINLDNRIKYFYKKNKGLSSARNTGLGLAKGNYIAFLDADDKWLPNKLENQIRILKKNNSDIVFSDFKYFNESGISEHNIPISRELTIYSFIAQNPINGSASSILLKKKVYNTVKLFDTNLTSLEDLDYWFRCYMLNFNFVFCPSKDVLLRNNHSGMSSNWLKMYCNHIKLLKKQIVFLKKHDYHLNSELKKAIHLRLSKIRWYAYKTKKKRLLLKTHLLGLKLLKLKYLNKLTIRLLLTFLFINLNE